MGSGAKVWISIPQPGEGILLSPAVPEPVLAPAGAQPCASAPVCAQGSGSPCPSCRAKGRSHLWTSAQGAQGMNLAQGGMSSMEI